MIYPSQKQVSYHEVIVPKEKITETLLNFNYPLHIIANIQGGGDGVDSKVTEISTATRRRGLRDLRQHV